MFSINKGFFNLFIIFFTIVTLLALKLEIQKNNHMKIRLYLYDIDGTSPSPHN